MGPQPLNSDDAHVMKHKSKLSHKSDFIPDLVASEYSFLEKVEKVNGVAL